jgi:pimeloyl-ACP methyl ester carboxylesterase
MSLCITETAGSELPARTAPSRPTGIRRRIARQTANTRRPRPDYAHPDTGHFGHHHLRYDLTTTKEGTRDAVTMINSDRRAFCVHGAIAVAALVDVFSRRAAADPGPGGAHESTASDYDAYCGNYRIGNDHVIGVDRFVLEDSGGTTLLISDYQSGVVRRLFPVSQTDFVMGPGFDTSSPAELNVRFVKDGKGDFAAISIQPTGSAGSVGERIALHEENVSFVNGDVTLAGTLMLPATQAPHPTIVLLHGSGPLTRYSFGPYPHFFTSLGLAVLIYDKRGTGSSNGTRLDASTADLRPLPTAYYPDDLANDAIAALRYLQGRPEIDPGKIGFWGSSEGGMLTTQVAARSKDIAYIINSSGFMGPLWKTLTYQVQANLHARGSPEADIRQALAFTSLWMRVARTGRDYELFLKQREAVRSEKKPWLSWFSDDFTSLEQMRWDWDHILRFDPLPALRKVTCPVLGVFGEFDLSTDASAATREMRRVLSSAGHKDFTLRVFPRAGHSLAEMPSGNRMAPGVFDTLSSWLLPRI